MHNRYYSSVITKINALIEQQKFSEAQGLITEELNAPYVPFDVIEQLQELQIRIDRSQASLLSN